MSTVFDEAVLEDRPEIDLSVLQSVSTEREEIVLLAIDIGSSGTRAALFTGGGEQIDGSLVTVPSSSFSSLISGDDIDPDSLLTSVVRAIDLAVSAPRFSSHASTMWPCHVFGTASWELMK